LGAVDHNPESSSGERHQNGGLAIFAIPVGGRRPRDFGGMNGQRTLQLPSGFTFIDGLRKRIGSEVGKDFPVDDLPAIALELISDNKLVTLPVRQFTHDHATSGIRAPAPDDSVALYLSVPPNDAQTGKLPVAYSRLKLFD
jgi:hypothetical protein